MPLSKSTRCTFIPPYLLRHLVAREAGPSRSPSATLRLDERLRASRDAPPRTLQQPQAAGDDTRVVHDAKHTEQLPGDVARRGSDQATGDAAVDEAFDYSGLAWDLFETQFNRRSVDGNGTTLSVTVHYGQDYDNAFWDGQQLVFGDGDGEVFDRFTKPMDVMVHEFTHGVTQFTAGLAYQGQSGALNESVSDVFASMGKQKLLGQTADQADWLIGEGIFLPGINARALRSMIEPGTAYDDPQLGKDPQVASMADYVDTEEDSGGVHINSGIPNRAFALAALAIGGNCWEQAGQTWYDALTSGEVTAQTDFVGFAQATVNSAARLYADDTQVAEQVKAAWATVGVLDNEASPTEPDPVPVDAAPLPTDPDPAPTDPAPTDPAPTDPAPTDPAPGPMSPQLIAVRRSGGFAGNTRAGELDLDADPEGPEVRMLLTSVDLAALTASPSAPDRFVYTVVFGDYRVTVPEQDLTPELHRVVQIVLGDRSGGVTLT